MSWAYCGSQKYISYCGTFTDKKRRRVNMNILDKDKRHQTFASRKL